MWGNLKSKREKANEPKNVKSREGSTVGDCTLRISSTGLDSAVQFLHDSHECFCISHCVVELVLFHSDAQMITDVDQFRSPPACHAHQLFASLDWVFQHFGVQQSMGFDFVSCRFSPQNAEVEVVTIVGYELDIPPLQVSQWLQMFLFTTRGMAPDFNLLKKFLFIDKYGKLQLVHLSRVIKAKKWHLWIENQKNKCRVGDFHVKGQIPPKCNNFFSEKPNTLFRLWLVTYHAICLCHPFWL